VDQADRPADPIDHGADGRAAVLADDQVIPVANPLAGLHDRRPVTDQQRREDKPRTAFGGLTPTLTQRPTGTQLGGQGPAQAPFSPEIQRLVDRLVAHMPPRSDGTFAAQLGADLLRTPGVLKLPLHRVSQFGIDDEGACSLAAGVIAGPCVREIGVIDTLVVRLEVAM
jgi:hypothetical protein